MTDAADWVTAIATAGGAVSTTVLVGVTWRYVRLTRELARGPSTPSIHALVESDRSLSLHNTGGSLVNFRGNLDLRPRIPSVVRLSRSVLASELPTGASLDLSRVPDPERLDGQLMDAARISALYAVLELHGVGESRGGERFTVRRQLALAPRIPDEGDDHWTVESS